MMVNRANDVLSNYYTFINDDNYSYCPSYIVDVVVNTYDIALNIVVESVSRL